MLDCPDGAKLPLPSCSCPIAHPASEKLGIQAQFSGPGATAVDDQCQSFTRHTENVRIWRKPPFGRQGHSPTDGSQLWITADSFNSYDTNGTVTRIAAENARRIVATLRSEGEGTTFIAKKGLTLSPERNSLTVRDEDNTGRKTFHRCSVAETAPTFIPHHTLPPRWATGDLWLTS
jgi:hypothetical protein